MTDFEDIRVSSESGIGTITIDRGDGRTALRPQSLAEICTAMDRLAANAEVRTIVLAANGTHFSAGADFKFLKKLTDMKPGEIKAQVYEHFQGAARRIYNCPKPTLALLQGAVVTVGCELALACDFRIASETVMFQESWIKLGIMPPLGGLFLLPRTVGLGLAKEMCLMGKQVHADEALRAGLVHEIVASDDLAARGNAFAAELAAAAPTAYASIKEAIHRGLESSMQSEWTANVASQSVLISSEDFAEGLDAVVNRRAPQFTGR